MLELAWHGSRLKNSSCEDTKNTWELSAAKSLQSLNHRLHLGSRGRAALQFLSEHSCTWSEDSTFWDGFGARGTDALPWLCCLRDTRAGQRHLCTLSRRVHDPKDVFL